jgi:hypothetical protein
MERFKTEARDTLGDAMLDRMYDLYDECCDLADACAENGEELGVAALESVANRVVGEILTRQHELAPEKYPDPKERLEGLNATASTRRKQPGEP